MINKLNLKGVNNMRYPIAIEPGKEHYSHAVSFPDLPDCVTAGNTFQDAIKNAYDVFELYKAYLVQDGKSIPPASTIESHKDNPEYKHCYWTYIDIN